MPEIAWCTTAGAPRVKKASRLPWADRMKSRAHWSASGTEASVSLALGER